MIDESGKAEWLLDILEMLIRQIKEGSKTKAQLDAFLENRNPFLSDIRSEWVEFYWNYFRLSVDFKDVIIPDNPGDFDRVIFIPKGLTIAMAISAMRSHFKVDTGGLHDIDQQIKGRNVREANLDYAVRFHDRQDADQELELHSYNQVKASGINCITLLERLVYELKYWAESGQYLDMYPGNGRWHTATLCAGSRLLFGRVVTVFSPYNHGLERNEGIDIRWWEPSDTWASIMSPRQAVC